MKIIKIITVLLLPILTVVVAGCDYLIPATSDSRKRNISSDEKNSMASYQMDNDETVYVYGKEAVLSGEEKVPLVLFMCGTSGDPQEQAIGTGWADKAQSEDIIVISPEYDDYATYSEVDYILSVVHKAVELYPVDTSRVYSLGFSRQSVPSFCMTI